MTVSKPTLRLIAMTFAVSSIATDALGDGATVKSSVDPNFISGKLDSCSINFLVARSDVEYAQGANMLVGGSITVVNIDHKSPRMLLKLGVAPLGTSDNRPPSEAVVVDGLKTNAADLLGSAASDTPGYRNFVFNGGPQTMAALARSFSTGRFSVAYAMRKGGVMATFDIDMTMARFVIDTGQLDPGAPKRWSACVSEVLKQSV